MIITIDGPAGSGKTTVAKKLAERLGFYHLNSGRLYRWIAYNVKGKDNIIETAKSLSFNNIDDTNLYTEEISDYVPNISKISEIREIVLKEQRKIGENDVVAEGRDIGTTVFPNADIKVYLDASQEERAKRRLKEYEKTTFEEVLKDIKERDEYDINRECSPLRKAEDAIVIDSTSMSIDEVVEKIYDLTKI